MSGHGHCCKGKRAPRTVAAFAALNYPSNPSGHHDVDNRIHNPEKVRVRYEKAAHKRMRRGWWFRLKSAEHPPLLDGSGDAVARGTVDACAGIEPVTPGDRLVCFNAANLKTLPMPGGGRKVCGFTWNVRFEKVPGQPTPAVASGWMPLSAIEFKSKKSRPRVMAALRSWECCMKKHAKWGKALTKGTKSYQFRSVAELESELAGLHRPAKAKKFKKYFRERVKGSVRKLIKKALGKRDGLAKLIGILPFCKTGNKLTDYLPKGADRKSDQGYTNLSANVSVGKNRPGMAPIGFDILPAGHTFHRLKFRGNRQVLGFIYRVPKKPPGKIIGRVVWYYGYTVLVASAGIKQRRYGWVPALALK